MRRAGWIALGVAAAALGVFSAYSASPVSRETTIRREHAGRAPLEQRLTAGGFRRGQPVFVRILKEEGRLELWMRRADGWRRFATYRVCARSGALGPKLKEGDGQAPEGFYVVGPRQLNPHSAYRLAFNLGFPNAYDAAQGRTGSALMVHGACVSAGCFAMTDGQIDEIYGLVEAALEAGQAGVPVHLFPFEMTAANLARRGNDGPAAGGTWRRPGRCSRPPARRRRPTPAATDTAFDPRRAARRSARGLELTRRTRQNKL